MCAVRTPSRQRRTIRFGLLAGLALAGTMNFSAPASAQGLFEALFGRQTYASPPPAPSYYPPIYQPRYRDYPAETRRRAAVPRELRRSAKRSQGAERHAAVKAVKEEPGPKKYVAPEVLPGPLGQFLRDATLKRGDVVATSQGLMVFRGEGGRNHSPKDFVALSNAGSFAAGNRADLAALEKAVGRLPVDTGAQLAQADAPIVAQDDPDENRRKRTR
ncbi:MAG: hypothetical protein JWN93_2195 [Hyphomicrobiales bacterium]|nr:hypothetical protein [Hyphomicrobiales bacterium]